MDDFLDVDPRSNPLPTRFGSTPLRIRDRRNALLALEKREGSQDGALIAHFLADGMYVVESVQLDIGPGAKVERQQQ